MPGETNPKLPTRADKATIAAAYRLNFAMLPPFDYEFAACMARQNSSPQSLCQKLKRIYCGGLRSRSLQFNSERTRKNVPVGEKCLRLRRLLFSTVCPLTKDRLSAELVVPLAAGCEVGVAPVRYAHEF